MHNTRRSLVDYHTHSCLSFDGRSTIDEMCQRAVKMGFVEVGFSEHVEFQPEDSGYGFFDYERYTQMIEQARREYDGRLRIRKGVEVGYCPKYEAESRKWLERKDFDYVIGAIHYIDDIAFDLRRDLGIPPNVAIKKYFAEIRQAAESGLFDVIAHFDLIRDYLSADHYQLAQATELIDAAFELMVSENVCLEINSRRSVEGETYPSRELISRYVEKGGRLFSIGSDAHSVSEFGVGVVEAMKVLNNLKSGTSHVLFE